MNLEQRILKLSIQLQLIDGSKTISFKRDGEYIDVIIEDSDSTWSKQTYRMDRTEYSTVGDFLKQIFWDTDDRV